MYSIMKQRQKASLSPNCGSATLSYSGAEGCDILYTPVNCKAVSLLCSWWEWSIDLTSLFAIASPSPSRSFSSPLSLPQKWIRPPCSSRRTDSSSQKQCFLLCRAAGWLHALWLTTTASCVLHISESDHKIISFSATAARRTALSFYFTLHLRSRGNVIVVAKATCKLFKILPNSLPLILSAFFFLFSTFLFLYSSIL